ncbi:phosphate transporter subunit; membrane component of ABC superfamily [Candidatus Sulfopaludibacter sp. SbA4]|nr:phosphate transporter subunit; membrane component of ABC superfamily [Candidatus Sulfopaludibacter sp. SbA4]
MSRLLIWRKLVNGVMLSLTGVCTVLTVAALFAILGLLIYNGGKSLSWSFFTQLPAPPGELGGGLANAIVGSVQIVGAAALIGIPIGFFAGVYLSEYEDKMFASVVRYVADLLNGVPSIVVGILAWALVVKPMGGFSGLAGSAALSVMLIPIVTRQTEQFLREVPLSLREAALALGANKWKMIATVVVPAGSKGVLTGMILGVARISGESAPLLFTALSNQFWGGLTEPTASLPVMIYKLATSPYDDWNRQAWAGGLVLIGLVLIANVSARLVLARGVSVPRG